MDSYYKENLESSNKQSQLPININEDNYEDNEIENPLFKQSKVLNLSQKDDIPNMLKNIKNSLAENSKNDFSSLDNDKNIINNININQIKNEFENKNKIIKTCLKNNGETYYLNSILQNIGNIEYLKDYFLKDNNIKIIEKNSKQYPLSYVTQKIFDHFYIKRDEKYSLKSFSKILAYLNLKYASKKNKNVNECFVYILNTLHNELNSIKNPPNQKIPNKYNKNEVIDYGIINSKNSDISIISDTFTWYKITELHCTQCGELTYDFNSYNIFQLNLLEFKKINDRIHFNIYDMINHELTKKEESYCENCRNKNNVNKLSFIYSSPKIFVFFLEKGDFDEELLNIEFILEEIINLNKFIEEKKSPKKYELIGIISMDINDKKYHSFCKSFEDQLWYHFNDEIVIQKSDKQVIFHHGEKFIPNILFYKAIE